MFTVATWKNTTTWTVTVNGSTSYVDPAVSGTPSFVNVCVGDVVGVTGTVSSTTDTVNPATKVVVSPAKTMHQPSGVFGTVASVNGSSMAGACGIAGDMFTLTAWKSTTIWTVTVNGSTTYVDPGTSGATFVNVCVGELAGAVGTVSSATDTVNPATKVFIAPVSVPSQPQGVFGTVASVNGSSMAGACGTAGDMFTVATWKNTTTWTVTVNGSTSYVDPAVSGTPSFVNVCVGDVVGVTGTVSSTTDTVNPATKVTVSPAKTMHQPPGDHG